MTKATSGGGPSVNAQIPPLHAPTVNPQVATQRVHQCQTAWPNPVAQWDHYFREQARAEEGLNQWLAAKEAAMGQNT